MGCTNKSERLRRRRQKVSPQLEEVGSSYRPRTIIIIIPLPRPGFAPQITNCLATPLGPRFTCWHCGFQRFSCPIKEWEWVWVPGNGVRELHNSATEAEAVAVALAGNIWQHAKTKAFVAGTDRTLKQICGKKTEITSL